MPIYDYQCQDCGHVFDVLQKMADAPLTDCPACGAAALQKLLSAPSFQLKGKGWRKPKAELKKTVRRGHMFDQAVPHAEHTRASSDGGDHDSGPGAGKSPGGAAAAASLEKKIAEHSKDHGHSHGHAHGHSHGPGHSHEH
jgi:putative FmdB family regulatory protein